MLIHRDITNLTSEIELFEKKILFAETKFKNMNRFLVFPSFFPLIDIKQAYYFLVNCWNFKMRKSNNKSTTVIFKYINNNINKLKL